MTLIFSRFTAAIGLIGCLFGAAEVGVLANYYARVEDRARAWCSARSYCKSVHRQGSLASPELIVLVKGSANSSTVESEMRAAGATKAPRQEGDPQPREVRIIVRADARARGGKS